VSKSGAVSAYGMSVGMAMPLLFLPSTLIGSLAMALVPELASKLQKKQFKEVQAEVGRAIMFSISVCALSMPLFIAAGRPLGLLLYNNAEVGDYLVKAAWTMLPISLEQITSSMMNSLGLELKSYRNYCVTIPIMVACVLALPFVMGMNAYFVAMGASAAVQTVLHIFAIRKKIGLTRKFMVPVFGCAVAAAAAATAGRLATLVAHGLPPIAEILIGGLVAFVSALVLCTVFGILPAKQGKFLRGLRPGALKRASVPKSFLGFF